MGFPVFNDPPVAVPKRLPKAFRLHTYLRSRGHCLSQFIMGRSIIRRWGKQAEKDKARCMDKVGRPNCQVHAELGRPVHTG